MAISVQIGKLNVPKERPKGEGELVSLESLDFLFREEPLIQDSGTGLEIPPVDVPVDLSPRPVQEATDIPDAQHGAHLFLLLAFS